MILGLGLDSIEIKRVRAAYERFGGRFLDRLFTDVEKTYCLRHNDPVPSLAARFAAKEAAVKAFAEGFGGRWCWRDMEVAREKSGRPKLVLNGIFRELADRRGVRRIHLTLSHDRDKALAIVVLEGEDA